MGLGALWCRFARARAPSREKIRQTARRGAALAPGRCSTEQVPSGRVDDAQPRVKDVALSAGVKVQSSVQDYQSPACA